ERNVSWQRLTGHPIGTTLLYQSDGIFRDEEDIASYPHVSSAIPGDIRILDYNGDGEITNDDRVLMDITSTPRINYGVDLSLSFKNWKIKTLIQGVGGVKKQV